MASSPARLAANRQNALKSTGPKTPEGKAASRLNAFQHGLASAGDLVGPGEDADLVATRAAAFAAELGAPGVVGRTLAHRAALLSIRMERAADREQAVVTAAVQAARDQFDADRRDALERGVEALAQPGDPRPALAALEATAAGVAYLTIAWIDLHRTLSAGDPAAAPQAARWLGLAAGAEPAAPPWTDLTRLVAAERDRIAALAASVVSLEAVAAQRAEVGLIASFDPSPEATLARRYEAAAERGMYRALRAIADLRRAQDQPLDSSPLALGADLLAPPPPPPRPAPPRPGEPARTPPPPPALASFRAGVETPAAIPPRPLDPRLEPDLTPADRRKKRPDLRKIGSNRR